jgi:hypothetical protein
MDQNISAIPNPQSEIRNPQLGAAAALRAFLFWTYSDSIFGRLTVRVTGHQLPDKSDAWSHMGIAFRLADFSIVYYENLFRTGFQGPKPFQKLTDFRKAGGRLAIRMVDMLPAECEEKRQRCEHWVGNRRGYFHLQLIGMWKFERLLRFYHAPLPPSPNRGVCSEDAARIVYPRCDLRDSEREFDEINPNSAWRQYLKLFPDTI